MDPVVGSGEHTYEVNENWARVPDGIDMRPAAVAVDSRDRVFCFNRSSEHPVVIFDRDGNFESSWGAGMFKFPHAIRFDEQDRVWLTDEHTGQFMLFTNDGKLLRTIGVDGQRADTGVPEDDFSSVAWKKVTHGGGPFNLPTDIAIIPSGEMYMTDGYGNARVHKFSADGKYLFSWGEPGNRPGQFNLPHGIWYDSRGRLLVADRENDRVQVFHKDGRFVTEWRIAPQTRGMGSAWDLAFWPDAPQSLVRGRRRKRFLVRADRTVDLQGFLAAWRARFKPPASVRVTIDVDPYSFL